MKPLLSLGFAAPAILTAAVISGGCVGGLHSDLQASQVYVLRSTRQADDPAPRAKESASIRISRPDAGPGLATDHIVLIQSDHRMSYYLASRWPAGVPEVVEALAVDSFRTSGHWSSVQDSTSTFPTDYVLQIVIRRFEADYTKGALPEVHVVLDCTLGTRTGREVLGSFMAEGAAAAGENRLAAVVAAFEVAANQALSSVLAQSLAAESSARGPAAPPK